jgi:hypothetical protein
MVGMTPSANPDRAGDDRGDATALATYASELADAVAVAVPTWVQRMVATRWEQWQGGPPPAAVDDATRDAAAEAAITVVVAVRALLETDVAEQRTNPLALLRDAVVYPTRVLAAAGMPEVARDREAERLFPHDVYDLTPGSFADVDPTLHEPGLRWGAAKAHVLKRRRAG